MRSADAPPRAAAARATWRGLHDAALARLGAPMEVRWLVEEAAGGRWPGVLEEAAGDRARRRFEAMVDRRAGGEPLQYVLGRWAFRGLDLLVDRRVLIPRPETEQVVEVALAELDARSGREAVVVDLGTGSGAIGLAIAAERPGASVWATDVSADALAVAGANLAGLGGRAATRVRLAAGSWWAALPGHLRGAVDLAVANPPYLASAELDGLDPVVSAWEPPGALVAGPSGLEAVREVVAGAPAWLRPGGVLVVEIAPHQAAAAVELAGAAGLVGGRVEPDLAGRPRALVARRAGVAGPAGRSR